MLAGRLRALSRGYCSSRAALRYCVESHTWLQHVEGDKCRIGLTRRGFEDVGDIVELIAHSPVGTSRTARAAESLLGIRWEAMQITSADELYHARWANVEGEHCIPWPGYSARITGVNPDAATKALDHTDWLVELALCTGFELAAQEAGLLSEREYLDAIRHGDGLFGEEAGGLSDAPFVDNRHTGSYGQ